MGQIWSKIWLVNLYMAWKTVSFKVVVYHLFLSSISCIRDALNPTLHGKTLLILVEGVPKGVTVYKFQGTLSDCVVKHGQRGRV